MKAFTASIVGLISAVALFEGAQAKSASLSTCAADITESLNNLLQSGQAATNFAQCSEDNSGNGYAAGMINFTTGSGDAWEVIKAYMDSDRYSNEFAAYADNIDTYVKGTGSTTSGFSGFCSAWKKAADNTAFWTAQESVTSSTYYTPAMKLAGNLGVSLDVTKAAIYDSAIVDGPGDDSTSVGGIIDATNNSINEDMDVSGSSNHTIMVNGYKVNEIKWLELFLKQRVSTNSDNKANAASYNYIISNGDYSWSSDSITALDDSGNKHTIKCSTSSDD
ncbi:hypothetical protein EV175_000403 [Coemansia sp. RSA 1933]|nr:hypothetical protein EV175_000403 [Coemansia sp. RSA 1933]